MLRSIVEKLLPIERSWKFSKAQSPSREEVVARLVNQLRAAGVAEVEVGVDGVIRFHTGLFRLALWGNPLNGVAAGEMRVMEDAKDIIVGSRVEFRAWLIYLFLGVNFVVWVATGVLGCLALPTGLIVGAVGCGLLLVMLGVLRGSGVAGLVHRATRR